MTVYAVSPCCGLVQEINWAQFYMAAPSYSQTVNYNYVTINWYKSFPQFSAICYLMSDTKTTLTGRPRGAEHEVYFRSSGMVKSVFTAFLLYVCITQLFKNGGKYIVPRRR
jgi:hypothetical protein